MKPEKREVVKPIIGGLGFGRATDGKAQAKDAQSRGGALQWPMLDKYKLILKAAE